MAFFLLQPGFDGGICRLGVLAHLSTYESLSDQFLKFLRCDLPIFMLGTALLGRNNQETTGIDLRS